MLFYFLIDVFGVGVLFLNEVHESSHNFKKCIEHVIDEGVHESIIVFGRTIAIFLGFLSDVNYDYSNDVHHDSREAHAEANGAELFVARI